MLTNLSEAVLVRRLAWRVFLMATSSLIVLAMLGFCIAVRPF